MLMASSKGVKNRFKRQTMKEPKPAELEMVCKRFTAVFSEEKPKSGPMVIEKAIVTEKCPVLYDEII